MPGPVQPGPDGQAPRLLARVSCFSPVSPPPASHQRVPPTGVPREAQICPKAGTGRPGRPTSRALAHAPLAAHFASAAGRNAGWWVASLPMPPVRYRRQQAPLHSPSTGGSFRFTAGLVRRSPSLGPAGTGHDPRAGVDAPRIREVSTGGISEGDVPRGGRGPHQGVDGRNKSGHDGGEMEAAGVTPRVGPVSALPVMPVKAGVQYPPGRVCSHRLRMLGPRLRGDDRRCAPIRV
jgi:hypothetical protein